MSTSGGDIIAGLTTSQDNGPPAAAYYGSLQTEGKARSVENPYSNGPAASSDAPSTAPTDQAANDTPAGLNPAALNTLAGVIRDAWTRNKRARDRIDYRLLACLRARRAEYSAVELTEMWSADAGEPIYLPVAATKMRAAEASLRELILPDNETPWEIVPDPVGDLPLEIQNAVEQKYMQIGQQKLVEAKQQQGKIVDFVSYKGMLDEIKLECETEARNELASEAKERAARMAENIQTVMNKGGYYTAVSDFVQHFCTYPTAVLKGPFLVAEKEMTWEKGNNTPVAKTVIKEIWKAVNPFDVYPAAEAASCQDGDFIERIRLTRADLYEMIGVPGYNETAIRLVLMSNASGGLRGWLWTDMERQQLEGVTWETWQPDYLVDALHYWGSVQGKDLISYGMQIDGDELAYYEVDAVLIDNQVIRCEINDNPLGRRPYHAASYDEVPGAFWGNSIYDLIADCTAIINACARALNANLGIASGPIMGVDMSQLAAGQDPKSLRPLDVLQLDRSRAPQAQDPLVFYQAKSMANDLLGIIEAFESKADDESGIPRYMYGNQNVQGAAATKGGLLALMGQASKGLQRASATIDRKVIEPTVYDTYVHEMMYGKDEAAKGAASVTARGSRAALIKEHLQQVRTQFLQQIDQSPHASKIIGDKGYAAVLRELVGVLEMNVDSVVPTDEELEKQAANTPPPQPSPDAQLAAQVDKYKVDQNQTTELTKTGIIHPQVAMQMIQAARAEQADNQQNENPNAGMPLVQQTAVQQ